MSRKRFSPATEQFDERLIVRKQEAFQGGTVSDIAAEDIPYNAVARLVNARGHKNAIRGRTGVSEWSSMTIPETGSFGAVYDSVAGTLKNSGSFVVGDVGSTYYGDNGDILFVKEYVSATTMKVKASSGLENTTYTSGKLVPRINAQFFDSLNSVRYFLIGSKVYARIGRESQWIEYTILGSQPANTTSQMFKLKDKIVLTNSSGVFMLNGVYDGKYGWKTNDVLPEHKLDMRSPEISATRPSAYNYLYTYTRLNGNYEEDRNSIDTYTEIETPPLLVEADIVPHSGYDPEVLNTDYTTIHTNEPIHSLKKQEWGIGVPDFNTYINWVSLSEDNHNPSIQLVVSGNKQAVYFDFANAESMDDVTGSLQRGLKDYSTGFSVLRKIVHDPDAVLPIPTDRNVFVIYHSDPDFIWSISSAETSSPDTADLVLNKALISVPSIETMGVTIGEFRYPENRHDITHYSAYRTKDIYPYTLDPVDLTDPRIGNSSNIYSWVADIPVIDVLGGSISTQAGGWILDLAEAVGDYLIGSTYTISDTTPLTKFKVESKVSDVQYVCSLVQGVLQDYFSSTFFTGTDTEVTASKVGQDISFTGYTPVESDIGKPVFWSDGTVSYLSSTTTTIDSNTKSSQKAYINPTSRKWYDTMSDNIRDGYAEYLTLKTRFYDKLPQSNLAAYNKGLLVLALRDYNKIYYTGTSDVTTIGYHHPNQANDSIEKGIRCLFVVGDVFSCLTTSSTHTINPKQATVIEDDYGAFYTLMPDAFLVNGSIGAASQFRWAQGEKGDVMVVTNEPAVRFFDGTSYTANLADGKIQHTELQLMNENMLTSYSSTGGIHIWGFRSELWK